MTEQNRPTPKDFFKDWKQREALAEGMIPIIGKLYRERNVSTYMYGTSMVNMSVIDLMKSHRRVRQVEQNELSEFDSAPMIEAIAKLQLGPAHLDLGKMVVKYQAVGNGRPLINLSAMSLRILWVPISSRYPSPRMLFSMALAGLVDWLPVFWWIKPVVVMCCGCELS